MSDIFISYASEDREQAKALAQALESEGWSVWWDRLIPFGRPFDDVIQENIDAAKCVLVLWTANSVASKWVRSEASEAEERNVLIPVLLDRDADIPLAFKLLQAADLADWQPGFPHGEFTRLVNQITTLLDAAARPAPNVGASDNAARAARTRRKAKRLWPTLGFVVLPSALAAGAALVLMMWRTPTQVEIALRADRLKFMVGGADPASILDGATTFESLTIERISRVAFSGSGLRQIAPAGVLPVERGAVAFEGRPERGSSVTIERDGEGAAAGRLESISAEPAAEVVLEVRSSGKVPSLTLRVDGQELAPLILPLGAFRLTATQARIVSPLNGARGLPSMTIRATVSEADEFIRVKTDPASFAAVITPPAGGAVELFGRTGIPITQLELTRLTERGSFESSLRGNATIRFPGYRKEPVVLDATALIGIDDLRNASLSPTRVDSTQPAMEVTFTGEVGKLQSRVGSGPPTEQRLSVFDRLWYGSPAIILFSILVWAVPVSIGVYKLYKDAGADR